MHRQPKVKATSLVAGDFLEKRKTRDSRACRQSEDRRSIFTALSDLAAQLAQPTALRMA